MAKCELPGPGQSLHRPYRLVTLDVVQDLGREYEEAAVDIPVLAARLLDEGGDAIIGDLQRAEAARRPHRSDGRKPPMSAMEGKQSSDVYGDDAVAVSHAEIAVADEIAGHRQRGC